MYNLIYAKSFAETYSVDNLTAAGCVSLCAIAPDGSRKEVGEGFKGAFDLILGRSNAAGGPVSIPFNTLDLKITRGDYKAPVTFEASIPVPSIDQKGEVSLVISKKGVHFNERSNWTVNFPVLDTMASGDVADKIVAAINANTVSHGLVATKGSTVGTTTTVSVEAVKAGDSYVIAGDDLLRSVQITVSAEGDKGYGTLDMIKCIASKAAADAGFEYTYQEGATLLYPNYPINPLKGEDAEDKGFTVVTLRCGEPRAAKTHDEVVFQTVFVVFPTDSAESGDVKKFVDVLKTIGTLTSERAVNDGSSSSAPISGETRP